jgi:beta-1,4-N-acetylglucosaminyltransferase
MKKICLISSSGGHFEQLLCLESLNKNYETFFVTEKTKYNKDDKKIKYFVKQVNRKELLFIPKMIIIFFKSLFIFIKEKPDIIISTGVLSTIPMLFIGHFFKKKVIYIESFAKINSPTMTGKLIYKKKIADQFYVQWESMLKFYPNAIYKGGIY